MYVTRIELRKVVGWLRDEKKCDDFVSTKEQASEVLEYSKLKHGIGKKDKDICTNIEGDEGSTRAHGEQPRLPLNLPKLTLGSGNVDYPEPARASRI